MKPFNKYPKTFKFQLDIVLSINCQSTLFDYEGYTWRKIILAHRKNIFSTRILFKYFQTIIFVTYLYNYFRVRNINIFQY